MLSLLAIVPSWCDDWCDAAFWLTHCSNIACDSCSFCGAVSAAPTAKKEQLQVQLKNMPASLHWVKHAMANCWWSGNGAEVELETPRGSSAPNISTLALCQDACQAIWPECEGVLFSDASQCYRKGAITVEKCHPAIDVDLYTLEYPQPPVPPSPTPMPPMRTISGWPSLPPSLPLTPYLTPPAAFSPPPSPLPSSPPIVPAPSPPPTPLPSLPPSPPPPPPKLAASSNQGSQGSKGSRGSGWRCPRKGSLEVAVVGALRADLTDVLGFDNFRSLDDEALRISLANYRKLPPDTEVPASRHFFLLYLQLESWTAEDQYQVELRGENLQLETRAWLP